MYDSAMQGFIQGMTLDELAEWFDPHEYYDLSVPSLDIGSSRTEDSVQWMNRNFPFVQIPWLHTGDHTEIIDDTEGEFGDLIAYGDAGYLYVSCRSTSIDESRIRICAPPRCGCRAKPANKSLHGRRACVRN